MLNEHDADCPPMSPYWSIWGPGLDRVLSAINVSAGPAAQAASKGAPLGIVNGVGVVRVSGPLEKRDSFFLRMMGGTSYLRINQALNAAVADKKVEEIMLHIDTPGGSCDGLREMADTIRAARATKPVTAFIDGLGASAGYFLASQATTVVAGPTALVGCIGTVAYTHDLSKAFEKAGIETVVFKTGPVKGMGIPGTEITDVMKKNQQDIVDFFGADFRAAIVQGRRMDPKAVEKLATGAIWPAPTALDLGLVDQLGTFNQTVGSLTTRVRNRAQTRRLRAERIRLDAE